MMPTKTYTEDEVEENQLKSEFFQALKIISSRF